MKKLLIAILMATIAVSWYRMISREMRIYKAERAASYCRAWISWENNLRVIDNSSGASGSGLFWVVFGGVMVNGRPGLTTIATTDDHTPLKFIGGVLVEDEPL